jgi:hypothetical protein
MIRLESRINMERSEREMVDELLLRAIAAGARAFADEIEASLASPVRDGLKGVPTPGSAQSMRILLERIAEVNAQGRGATADEVSSFAKEAGMDPRGTAGYYAAAGLLTLKDGGRWLTDAGKERLEKLQRSAA